MERFRDSDSWLVTSKYSSYVEHHSEGKVLFAEWGTELIDEHNEPYEVSASRFGVFNLAVSR